LQAVSGHISAQGVAKNQPAKLAAFEGLYQTTSNAPLTLAGWVDEKNGKVIGLQAPGALSFLAHNDFHAPVTGLNEFKPEDRPPVQASFQFFHAMVGVGFTLIAIAALGFLYFRKGTLHERRWLLWILVFSARKSRISSAGSPPKSVGSRGLSTVCCGRRKDFPRFWRRMWSCRR